MKMKGNNKGNNKRDSKGNNSLNKIIREILNNNNSCYNLINFRIGGIEA
jgi:hypothetical protein